jgi:glyoxylase-like metal-dependent hydrolase (beta-lactamase superfamily II)
VRVPEGQEPSIRAGELAMGEWIRPERALERYRLGEVTFAAPILWTLRALAEGEDGLAARLVRGPERAGDPVQRIELKWGIVLVPMKTRPLPPATHTNTYLVGEREMAIMDPGSGEKAELEKLFAIIDALAGEGRTLKVALATHQHPDHVGGIEAVRERYRIPIAAHVQTAVTVRADRVLGDGDIVELAPGVGEWNLRVLHTPGHARGHLCFLHPRTRSLFCGDHIPGGTGTVIIDPPDGNMAAYVRSLGRLLDEPIETLFPGHGSPQGAARPRIEWLISHRRKREALVLDALAEDPKPLDALVQRAYRDTRPELWAYAERSLLAHLEKLEADGRGVRRGERGAGERWARMSPA